MSRILHPRGTSGAIHAAAWIVRLFADISAQGIGGGYMDLSGSNSMAEMLGILDEKKKRGAMKTH